LLPESPRWLVSKDKAEEAYSILAKYHAGDMNSVLVQAEMAQIQTTLKLELEHSSMSWLDVRKTAGMRRRIFLATFLGLFTQMSGNTLISHNQSTLFNAMGFTIPWLKTRLSLGSNVLGLVTASIAALCVGPFPRRTMFMISSASMLLVFIGFTISFNQLQDAADAEPKRFNVSAGIAVCFASILLVLSTTLETML
jgi:Sugar (and other) transporter